MTSVLDLKNPKNRKANNNHSVSDVLNGDSESPELEIDTSEEIPDNPGIMPDSTAFPTTFTSTAIPQRAASGSAEPSTSLSWTAPDKHQELISHTWRKGVIIVLVVLAFTSLLWQGSILTAITFFALAMVTSMHFWREARHEKYEIHPHGIAVGGRFHHYHDLDSFWIHERPEGFHELSLCTGRLLNYYVKIPLKGQDPFEVRDVLTKYLPEKRHEEGLENLLRRKLGL